MRFTLKSAVVAAGLVAFGLSASAANAVDLAYWNFNDFTAGTVDTTARTAAFAADGGVRATTSNITTDASFIDGSSSGTIGITHFGGSTLGAAASDTSGAAGESLVLQGYTNNVNNGKSFFFSVNTTNYNAINVSYAARTSSTTSGFTAVQLAYALDGINFVNTGNAYTLTTSFGTQALDLSNIAGLNNNANAAFRLTFTGVSAASGNARVDNIVVQGNAASVTVPEAGTLALIAPALGVIGAVVVRRRKTA